MRICVHNCGRSVEECECRKENDPTDLGTSDQNIEVMREALQRGLGTDAELTMKAEFAFHVPENMQQDYIQRRIASGDLPPVAPEIKGIQMHGRPPHYFTQEQVERVSAELYQIALETWQALAAENQGDSLTELAVPVGTGFSKLAESLGLPTELKPGGLSVTFGEPSIREQFPEAVRGLAQKLLEDSNFSSALARYNPQLHPAGLLMLKEDGRQMSPEEMEQWIAELQGLPPIDLAGLENNFTPAQLAQWQIPTPELIRQLESQGVDCDLLRMYPHEVKAIDVSNIAAQCRNDDITKYYPKTYTIRNVGGDYVRWVPGKIYLARTKRGARRFRLQSVKPKEQKCSI